MELDPGRRYTVAEVRSHPWFVLERGSDSSNHGSGSRRRTGIISSRSHDDVEDKGYSSSTVRWGSSPSSSGSDNRYSGQSVTSCESSSGEGDPRLEVSPRRASESDVSIMFAKVEICRCHDMKSSVPCLLWKGGCARGKL